jgi:hypothetical protein
MRTCPEEKVEEQKDAFYEFLERLYLKAPKLDIKIVVGDFHVKVGKERGFVPNVGQYNLHEETNDNGWRMIDFAVAVAHCSSIKISICKRGDHQMVYLLIRSIMLRLTVIRPLASWMSDHAEEPTVVALITW